MGELRGERETWGTSGWAERNWDHGAREGEIAVPSKWGARETTLMCKFIAKCWAYLLPLGALATISLHMTVEGCSLCIISRERRSRRTETESVSCSSWWMGSIMQEWRVLLEGWGRQSSLFLSMSCSCSCPLVHWQQEGWVSERTERRAALLFQKNWKKSTTLLPPLWTAR